MIQHVEGDLFTGSHFAAEGTAGNPEKNLLGPLISVFPTHVIIIFRNILITTYWVIINSLLAYSGIQQHIRGGRDMSPSREKHFTRFRRGA